MSVKAKVIRVKQLVREPSGAYEKDMAGTGGLGSTKDYYFPGYDYEGEDEARDWFNDHWGLEHPEEFDIEYLELDGPHVGDPIFKNAQDVGHSLKIQDPSDCEIWAWNWPFDRSDEALQDALWVQLALCRPGFDGSEEWDYQVFLMRGEGEDIDAEVPGSDWAAARGAIKDFHARALRRAPEPTDWREAARREQERIFRKMLEPNVRALKRRLLQ